MPFYNGFLLSLSLCLDIGLANIAMMALAMQRGFGKGMMLGLGTCVGDLIYAVLAMAGMAALLAFAPVRWALWLGGSAILLFLTFKMVLTALRATANPATPAAVDGSRLALFGRGVLLALSSPTAILWFAAVGGSLIARQQAGMENAGLFLAGFFIAGVVWSLVLCGVSHQGGRLLGKRMLVFSYVASALIFAYFALYVMYSGYSEFILRGSA